MKKSVLTIFAAMVAGICRPLFAQDATAETASSSKSEFAMQAEEVSPIVFKTNDGVFACEQDAATGNITVKYVWPNPAVVYQASLQERKAYRPGRSMAILKIKSTYDTDANGAKIPERSKPELRLGIGATVVSLG